MYTMIDFSKKWVRITVAAVAAAFVITFVSLCIAVAVKNTKIRAYESDIRVKNAQIDILTEIVYNCDCNGQGIVDSKDSVGR